MEVQYNTCSQMSSYDEHPALLMNAYTDTDVKIPKMTLN